MDKIELQLFQMTTYKDASQVVLIVAVHLDKGDILFQHVAGSSLSGVNSETVVIGTIDWEICRNLSTVIASITFYCDCKKAYRLLH